MKHYYSFIAIIASIILISCSSGIKTTKSRNFSQAKYQKIAVMDLDGSDRAEGKALAESLVPIFMQAGFNVIERSGLEKLLQEQKLGMTGILDAGTISKIGSVAGVQALVLGSYHIKTKRSTVTTRTFRRSLLRRPRPVAARSVTIAKPMYDAISVRMVDVSTGEILFSAASTEEIGEDSMDDFLKKLSDEIVKAFSK